jgi:hypothetical protein
MIKMIKIMDDHEIFDRNRSIFNSLKVRMFIS